jgi:hypothetical protein
MRYLLMLYADENAGAAIPPELMAKAMDGMHAYQQALEKAGAFVSTSALGRTADARTLRMVGGEIHNVDGTFVSSADSSSSTAKTWMRPSNGLLVVPQPNGDPSKFVLSSTPVPPRRRNPCAT